MVGYAADLLARARSANSDLARAHRELEIIHDLTISLQNAPDVSEVQGHVLEAVTRDLGFRRAVVGLMDQPYMVLSFWRESDPTGEASERPALFTARLPVEPGEGFLSETILSNRIRTLPAGAALTHHPAFDRALDLRGEALVAPMTLREHPVGVLLVETEGEATSPSSSNMRSLQAIAGQAAVALGTTMLCIDRAQRLAVQEERMRFAREMHDTISQSLFGIAYSLDGLGKLLPGQPDLVKAELEQVRQAAEQTRAEIRQSILDIWPSALTAEVFASDLRRFIGQMCRPGELALDICVEGDFAALSPRRQRGLYRVAQEALTNVVKHASAKNAAVRLQVNGDHAVLRVEDDGRGFDPAQALARERDREHFGLKGMQERIEALSGVCEFVSQTGGGAAVVATVPLLPQAAESDE
jgi:two-component system, NarL family, sensor kinase